MPDAWGNLNILPQMIGPDFVNVTSGAIALTANIVYLYAFELFYQTTIVGARWCVGNAAPAGSTSMGLYTAAGAIVPGSDTGPIVNIVSTVMNKTYAPALSVQPGQYFMGIACTAGDSLQGVGPFNTSASRVKRATNVLAAGALPLTTGAIVVNTSVAPGMAFLVSGGLL